MARIHDFLDAPLSSRASQNVKYAHNIPRALYILRIIFHMHQSRAYRARGYWALEYRCRVPSSKAIPLCRLSGAARAGAKSCRAQQQHCTVNTDPLQSLNYLRSPWLVYSSSKHTRSTVCGFISRIMRAMVVFSMSHFTLAAAVL